MPEPSRAELVAQASPICHHCGEPVERVETRWVQNGDGDWVPGPTFMVCGFRHRIQVEFADA
jgi:hypothetical protein